MKNSYKFMCIVLITMLLAAGVPKAAYAVTMNPHFRYTDLFKVKQNSREPLYIKLLEQRWGGSWNDDSQVMVSYDQLGLCTQMLISDWNLETWEEKQKLLYSYDMQNRLVHIDNLLLENGEWIYFLQDDWIYDADRLVQIQSMKQNAQGLFELAYTKEFFYDEDTGRLTQIIETFLEFNSGNAPMNRFDYTWDIQGRPIEVQKYQKYLYDPAWQIDLRNTYTYLPQDQSTYEECVEPILFSSASNRLLDWSGFSNSLIDQNAIEYSIDEGISFNPYFQYEYVYNPQLVLTDRFCYCTFMGIHQLDNVMRYIVQNDTLSIATHYIPVAGNDELVPDYRFLYSVGTNTENEDPTVPVMPIKISVFPNPCQSFVKISIELPKPSQTRVDVYNIRGQRLKALCNESQMRGKRELTWNLLDDNGLRLASGIYLIKISSGKEQSYRKMVVLER